MLVDLALSLLEFQKVITNKRNEKAVNAATPINGPLLLISVSMKNLKSALVALYTYSSPRESAMMALDRSTLQSPPWRRALFVTLFGIVNLICQTLDFCGFQYHAQEILFNWCQFFTYLGSYKSVCLAIIFTSFIY